MRLRYPSIISEPAASAVSSGGMLLVRDGHSRRLQALSVVFGSKKKQGTAGFRLRDVSALFVGAPDLLGELVMQFLQLCGRSVRQVQNQVQTPGLLRALLSRVEQQIAIADNGGKLINEIVRYQTDGSITMPC